MEVHSVAEWVDKESKSEKLVAKEDSFMKRVFVGLAVGSGIGAWLMLLFKWLFPILF